MESFDSKVEDLEYLTAPETCLELVSQGINESQTLLMDPDGANRGAAPIPLFCQFPEAITISGGTTKIEINSKCPEPSCFTHLISYDQQTLDQLFALTDMSSRCSQLLEFNCLLTPLKDLVSSFFIQVYNYSENYNFIILGSEKMKCFRKRSSNFSLTRPDSNVCTPNILEFPLAL